MMLGGWIIYHGLVCTSQILLHICDMNGSVAVWKDHDIPGDSKLCVAMTTNTTSLLDHSVRRQNFRIEDHFPVLTEE